MRILVFSLLWATALMLFSSWCFASIHRDSAISFELVQAKVNFKNSDFESVTVVEQRDKTYGVEIKLTPSAANELARISNDGIGKTMNVVFNGRIVSASTIRSQLGDSFLITGLLKHDAESIARSIRE